MTRGQRYHLKRTASHWRGDTQQKSKLLPWLDNVRQGTHDCTSNNWPLWWLTNVWVEVKNASQKLATKQKTKLVLITNNAHPCQECVCSSRRISGSAARLYVKITHTCILNNTNNINKFLIGSLLEENNHYETKIHNKQNV